MSPSSWTATDAGHTARVCHASRAIAREPSQSAKIVRAARAAGIQVLTLFAFSEQNWDRPLDEVDALMELLYRYVLEERQEIMQNSIRLTAVGELDRLPSFVRDPLFKLMKLSHDQQSMTLCLALSYGGREDIARAARKLAEEVATGALAADQVDQQLLESRLQTAGLPPVDLLIRTSGEMRLSNFLLWQLAYAELIFVPTMWPEFRKQHLMEAISEYQARERRYGLLSSQVQPETLERSQPGGQPNAPRHKNER
jgi:undecaprenyl diphosphate synthase